MLRVWCSRKSLWLGWVGSCMVRGFGRLPRPFHVHIVRPMGHAAHTCHRRTVVGSNVGPFLLSDRSIFVSLLASDNAKTMARDVRTTVVHNSRTCDNDHDCCTLTRSIGGVFNCRCAVPARRNHNTRRVCVPMLVGGHRRRGNLSHDGVITFSGCFFSAARNRDRVGNYAIHGICVGRTFSANIHCSFGNGFSLRKLRHNVRRINPGGIPCVITAVADGSTNNRPISLTGLGTVCDVTGGCSVPIMVSSTHFTRGTCFVGRHRTRCGS